MIAAERQRNILELAHASGSVKTSDLAQIFQVSEETIRRDLDKITESGQVARTHGGATTSELQRFETDHSLREGRQLKEKKSIARKALESIKVGDTVMLDASSTALQLAALLTELTDIHIVTYSQVISELLSRHDGIRLTLLGGAFDHTTRSYFGMITENSLSHLRIDRFFFSCKGVDPNMGLSDANSEPARLKRAIIKRAESSCLMADHSKIGLRSNYFFSDLTDIPTLITDPSITDSSFESLKQSQIKILISKTP